MSAVHCHSHYDYTNNYIHHIFFKAAEMSFLKRFLCQVSLSFKCLLVDGGLGLEKTGSLLKLRWGQGACF